MTDVMRRPSRAERRNPGLVTLGGSVTNWKQCAILGLTPAEILAVRGESGTKATVQSKLNATRSKMRKGGWVFPRNPAYSDSDSGAERPFLRAIPPASAAGCDADRSAQAFAQEVGQAESAWEDECARQRRSNWGGRVRPGKAAGN